MIAVLLEASKIIPAFFAQAIPTCDDKPLFFIFPPWYKYLDFEDDPAGGCRVIDFMVPDDFLGIGLAIVDMLLRLAGLAAVVVVIIAGVGYITAQGNPEKAASARRRIYQAFIGLAIVFVAAALVSFIGNRLSGP